MSRLFQGIRTATFFALIVASGGLSGCSGNLEQAYGKSRGKSLNGTGVFMDLVKVQGHEVRSAVRLTEDLGNWSDVIVRFAQTSGPPDRDEANWYISWLSADPNRRLIYIPRDYDAVDDYWKLAIAQLPHDVPKRFRERVDEARFTSQSQAPPMPTIAKTPANSQDWFEVEKNKPMFISKQLGGPWAEGLKAEDVALPQHEVLTAKKQNVLLSGDGKPVVVEWERVNGSRVMVIGNASFLLNAALANRARRPIAGRLIQWIGRNESDEDDEGYPKAVAFVEGAFVMTAVSQEPSVFHLLSIRPFGWIGAQLFVLALIACLAKAPTLGRPKLAEPSGADRPAAHPEALGALLSRTGQAGQARTMLESYRRWRNGPSGTNSSSSKTS